MLSEIGSVNLANDCGLRSVQSNAVGGKWEIQGEFESLTYLYTYIVTKKNRGKTDVLYIGFLIQFFHCFSVCPFSRAFMGIFQPKNCLKINCIS